MAEGIRCPVCGENNSTDQDFCQYCQSRLRPLTGTLKGADAPLHPGQIPTKKVTAELEPILPQWLRDARDKARQSADDDVSPVMQQQASMPGSSASVPDLLAGLQSQSPGDDEDETPDWLANITGASPKSKKTGRQSFEERRVELGDKDDFAQETAPPDNDAPSWLTALQSTPPAGEKDELTEWFRESSGLDLKENGTPSKDPSSRINLKTDGAGTGSKDQASTPFESIDAPDWLNQKPVGPNAGDGFGEEIPSWLDSDIKKDTISASASPSSGTGIDGAEADSTSDDVPSWLHDFKAGTAPGEGPSENDWLKEHQTKIPEPPIKKHTTPLWLKGTDASSAPVEDANTPVWLTDSPSMGGIPSAASQPSSSEDESFGDIPSWLKAAAPQSSIFSETPAEQTQVIPPEASDWLSSFKVSSEPINPEPASPAVSPPDQPQESVPVPAFTADAFQDGSTDNLFTEMPDWLSSASVDAPSPASSPDAESLIPGELPSWVQAMRPVDMTVSKPDSFASDQTLETRGALSGLHGVLPAMPGYAPTSKPKAYSIKLQATQEQQAHAALLEQILAAEAEPVPITSFSPLRRSRSLRWFISLIVISLVVMAISLNTAVFSMPVGVPNEISGALQMVQNLTPDAPVLVAIDYHPARVGEMEAASAPMFEQMMVLKHPRLTFVSTNETGPVLAERFISGTLQDRGYQYGNQYLNLGYLPGGVMGIRAFTLNPPQAMPLDISLDLAWGTVPLQGISSISQFAALIVITDSADTARTWIEQTMSIREITPFPLVVISSAQATPMILPYYESGQISGIVNGLYGGAIFEQGRPGTARAYWDAYSLGMLLAMALILGGGLWSSFLALRERAAGGGR